MASKKTIIIFLVLLALLIIRLYSAPVSVELCRDVILHKFDQLSKTDDYSIKAIYEQHDNNGILLFYLVELHPKGFMIIAGDDDLPPVIGYSFKNTFDAFDDSSRPYQMIKEDIALRMQSIDKLPDYITKKRNQAWTDLLNGNYTREEQYWPNQDSTLTGGWVQVQWNQNAPYNDYCPWDTVTQQRSLAGCPAVATAQIIDYFTNIHDAQFDDNDDYYHSYQGRNFYIDDDYFTHGFPAFPTLNVYLNEYDAHKKLHQDLTNSDKAALVFACGVAATQVYTSSVSGTFYLSQVVDALEKFGYFGTDTIDESSPDFWDRLKQNMIDAQPAELTVLVTGGSGGHNVVVDGYCTLDEYHVNFGWGGSYNGWYVLPDEFPYSLTTIEGVTLDINSIPVPYYDPPSDLIYSTNQSPLAVDLSWDAPTHPDVLSYNIIRDEVQINTAPVYTQTYHDNTAVYGTPYEYYVTAIYAIGESNPSNTVTIDWTVSVDDPQNTSSVFISAYPNPFNPKTQTALTISFSRYTYQNSDEISIYNVKGSFVRKLDVNDVTHEMKQAIWNGKNAQEECVPSGVYFYTINNESGYHKVLILQ